MKMPLHQFCYAITALCTDHSASVTSWIRSPTRNKAKGGRTTSLHLTGMACDLVCDDPAQKPALVAAARLRHLDAVDEGDHVHVEADPNHA